MSINIDFYEQTGHFGKGEDHLCVRTITTETVKTKDIVRNIEQATTLTEADIRGALSALSSLLESSLRSGRSFHLEGFGYFTPRVEGEIQRNGDGRLWLKSAKVRTVAFRPEKMLVRKLGDAKITSANHQGTHSKKRTDEQLTAIARKLTAEKAVFTPGDFCTASGLTKDKTYSWLRKAESAGILKNTGSATRKLYVATGD